MAWAFREESIRLNVPNEPGAPELKEMAPANEILRPRPRMKSAEKPATPSPPLTLLSVILPARDEEASLPAMVRDLYQTFVRENVPHELVVVDDGSRDATWAVLQNLRREVPTLAPVQNPGPNGFGCAVVYGFDHSRGDACAIMMADASDSPEDAVRYWRLLNQGWECVFGSRFIEGGRVTDYPRREALHQPPGESLHQGALPHPAQ